MKGSKSLWIDSADRRNVLVDLKIHIPEKILQLNGQTRTVQATNNYSDLNVYLYFTVPVLNTSAEVLRTLNVSEGILVPITSGKNVKNRKFGFLVSSHDFEVTAICFL